MLKDLSEKILTIKKSRKQDNKNMESNNIVNDIGYGSHRLYTRNQIN